MAAIIICNGSIEDYSYYKQYFAEAEFVICTDGAAGHARKFGIIPNVLLGDFDSIQQKDLLWAQSSGVEIVKFPVEKDMTDTDLAIEYLISKGYKSLTIIGAIGTRLDHSLANIFILKKLQQIGVSGTIVNEHNSMTIIQDKIELQREENTKVSLLPISEQVEGVTTKGLYYPLDNATITLGSTWGISNEFVEDTAAITIEKGLLLVIKSKD